MFGSDFDYLRITAAATKFITHDPDYIKEGEERTATRRIFHDVEYDEFERRSLYQLKDMLKKMSIVLNEDSFTDQVMLRFLYSAQFIMAQAADLIKAHLRWLESNPIQITDQVRETIENGIVYLGGRDLQLRPTIIVDIARIDTNTFHQDDFLNSVQVIMAIAEDYMFFPGKVENWKVMIDTAGQEVNSLPMQTIHHVIIQLQLNFPQTLEQMYILNPSASVRAYWDIISQFIDPRTLSKIQLLSVFSPTVNGYDNSQVERRFNGTMPNIQQCWLPKNTIQLVDLEKQMVVQWAKKASEQPTQPIKQLNANVGTQADPDAIKNIDPVKAQFMPNSKIGVHMFSSNPFLSEVDHNQCPFCVGVFQVLNKPIDLGSEVKVPGTKKSERSQQPHYHQGPANIVCSQCQTKESPYTKSVQKNQATYVSGTTIPVQTNPTIQYPPLRLIDHTVQKDSPWYLQRTTQQQTQGQPLQVFPDSEPMPFEQQMVTPQFENKPSNMPNQARSNQASQLPRGGNRASNPYPAPNRSSNQPPTRMTFNYPTQDQVQETQDNQGRPSVQDGYFPPQREYDPEYSRLRQSAPQDQQIKSCTIQ